MYPCIDKKYTSIVKIKDTCFSCILQPLLIVDLCLTPNIIEAIL